jgi:hypothetical protein
MAKNMTFLESSDSISKMEKRGTFTQFLQTAIVLTIVFLIIYIHIDIFVASVLVSLNRFNPPVVHARSGERMTMHVANQVLASMRYNHPKPQVNVLVLGTVYTLGH